MSRNWWEQDQIAGGGGASNAGRNNTTDNNWFEQDQEAGANSPNPVHPNLAGPDNTLSGNPNEPALGARPPSWETFFRNSASGVPILRNFVADSDEAAAYRREQPELAGAQAAGAGILATLPTVAVAPHSILAQGALGAGITGADLGTSGRDNLTREDYTTALTTGAIGGGAGPLVGRFVSPANAYYRNPTTRPLISTNPQIAREVDIPALVSGSVERWAPRIGNVATGLGGAGLGFHLGGGISDALGTISAVAGGAAGPQLLGEGARRMVGTFGNSRGGQAYLGNTWLTPERQVLLNLLGREGAEATMDQLYPPSTLTGQ